MSLGIKKRLSDLSATADNVFSYYDQCKDPETGEVNYRAFTKSVAEDMDEQIKAAVRADEIRELLKELQVEQAKVRGKIRFNPEKDELLDAFTAMSDVGMALSQDLVDNMSFEMQASYLARLAPTLGRALPVLLSIL